MRPWDGKVVEPAVTDPPEPPANFPDIVVPALAEHLADARQGPADPFGDRFATQPEASSPGRRAIVREAQKVECLRLAHPALAPVQQRDGDTEPKPEAAFADTPPGAKRFSSTPLA